MRRADLRVPRLGVVAMTSGEARGQSGWLPTVIVPLHTSHEVTHGAIGGLIVVFSVRMFDRLKIDDPVGAISVHGVVARLALSQLHFSPGTATHFWVGRTGPSKAFGPV